MTSIKQMEIFARVAELKSFTKVANSLYMTQPAISWQIKSLEEQLGLPLIDRQDKKLDLTEAGEKFYETCQEILAIYHQAENMIGEYKGLKRGSLSIGASTIPGEYILPQLLYGFNKIHPGLKISVAINSSGAIIEELLKGKTDLAIVGAKIPSKGVDFLPWLKDELILVTSSNSKINKINSVKELIKYPLIRREEDSGSQIILEQALAKHDLSIDDFKVSLSFGSTQAVLNALGSNQKIKSENGLAFISVWAAKPLIAQKKLKQVIIPDLSIKRDFYIAVWQKQYMSKAATACQNFLLTQGKKIQPEAE